MSYLGVKFVNNFYFVVGVDVPGGLPGIQHAQGIAESWYTNHWTGIFVGGVRAPIMSYVPPECILEKLTVAPISDTFQWEYENPYVATYNTPGISGDGPFMPPEVYVNLGFNLEPVPVVAHASPFDPPPKRAWVEFGPIPREAVTSAGGLTAGWLADYNFLGQYCATNMLGIGTTAVYYPVRATQRHFALLGSRYSFQVGVSGGFSSTQVFYGHSRDAQHG